MISVPPRETHPLESPSEEDAAGYVVARDAPDEHSVEVPWATSPRARGSRRRLGRSRLAGSCAQPVHGCGLVAPGGKHEDFGVLRLRLPTTCLLTAPT